MTAIYDPRPRLADGPAGPVVDGWRCTACRYPVASAVPDCPVCHADVAPDQFGPLGAVSASTCLHVRVPGRTPPYAVAYVDLDDGPRVLVHTGGLTPVRPGTQVRLGAKNDFGDLTAAVTG